MSNQRKIYVASSWKNTIQPAVVSGLREQGHEVYDFRKPEPGNTGFSWSEIDPDWKKWSPNQYREALSHPLSNEGYRLDFNAMEWADTCVLLLPSGRSAHTEAGWMKGQGKQVYVFMPLPETPELMYKVYDNIFIDTNEFMDFFQVNKQEGGAQ